MSINESIRGPLLSLESKLHWTGNMDDQVSLVEAFYESYSEHMSNLDQIKQQLKAVKSQAKSCFEWVDSVLVHAIEHGQWAVFENANLCNPSILDRLNSLLEGGASSLCMNEQGLINEGTELR